MSIASPWLEVASVLVEILAHLTEIAKAPGEVLKSKPLIRPAELVRLRMHLSELNTVTRELARETHAGELSPRYHELREQWLQLFAPCAYGLAQRRSGGIGDTGHLLAEPGQLAPADAPHYPRNARFRTES